MTDLMLGVLRIDDFWLILGGWGEGDSTRENLSV